MSVFISLSYHQKVFFSVEQSTPVYVSTE